MKVTRRSVLDAVESQAIDLRQLQKAASRLEEKRAQLLDPTVYSRERLEKHKQELEAEHRTTVLPLLDRMKSRVADVEGAGEAWSPSRRRLEAAIADPTAAAALASRIALVPVGDLPALARQAVESDNLLLADAIASQSGRLAARDHESLARAVTEALDAMGMEETGPALEAVRQIGSQFAMASILAADAAGQPLTPVAKLTLAYTYPGPATTGGAV